MKKCRILVALVLTAALVCSMLAAVADVYVGQYITLGSYEQDNSIYDGKEPIQWLVLKVSGGKALVISRYVLDYLPYNTVSGHNVWKISTMRSWVGNTFLQTAFTSSERSCIICSSVSNTKKQCNPNMGKVNPGPDTSDYIFPLSYIEAKNYFGSGYDRQTSATAYARSKGATGTWWLRTPDFAQGYSNIVRSDGTIGYKKNSNSAGFRPAMWIDLWEYDD